MNSFREWVPQWLAVGMILFSVLVIQSVSGMYGVIFQHIVLSNGLDAYDTWMMLRVMLVGTSCFFAIALKLKSLFSRNRQYPYPWQLSWLVCSFSNVFIPYH